MSAASACDVWSFHSHAIAAGSFAKAFFIASGSPAASTGIGVQPVVSTPMPTMSAPVMPFDFFAARSAAFVTATIPSR